MALVFKLIMLIELAFFIILSSIGQTNVHAIVQSSGQMRTTPKSNRELMKSSYRRNQRSKTLTSNSNRSRSLYDSKESFTFATDYPDELDNHNEHPEDNDYHKKFESDINDKLNILIKLIDQSFEKTLSRIENMEKSIASIQNIIQSAKSSGQNNFQHESNAGSQQSLLNKMLNIHQQTYQVCKDALIHPKQPIDNCPTMTAICSMVRQYRADNEPPPMDYRRHGTTKHDSHLVISVGQTAEQFDQLQKSQAEQEEDLDAQAMKNVFGTFANWTLNQYVEIMHRKVAEGLDVMNFEIKEKIYKLSENVTSVERSIQTYLQEQRELSAFILDIREQTYNNEEELKRIYDHVKKQCKAVDLREQETLVQMAKTSDCIIQDENREHINELHNRTTTQIKSLFKEYFDKFVNYLDTSLPNIQSSFMGTTKPKSMVGIPSKRHSTPITTTARKFDDNSGVENVIIYDINQHQNEDKNTMDKQNNLPTKMVADFEPSKHGQQQQCTRNAQISYPKSCLDLKRHGATCNSVYVILTEQSLIKHVYCDMKHNDGGWTVILRRGKFSLPKYQMDFNANVNNYRTGFGDLHKGEFWIGLNFVHMATNQQRNLLEVDLMDVDDNYVTFVYTGFRLGDHNDGYRFYVNGIKEDMLIGSNPNWNLTNLARSLLKHNETKFKAINDEILINRYLPSSHRDCTWWFRSGWWYIENSSDIDKHRPLVDTCRHLNAFQLMAPLQSDYDHLQAQWTNWLKDDNSGPRQLKYILMKIRPET